MEEQQIKLLGLNAETTDTANLQGTLFDVFLDVNGFANKRPGLSTITTTSGADQPTGLFYWPSRNETIVFSQDKLFTLSPSNVFTYRGDISTYSGSVTDPVSSVICRMSGSEFLAIARGDKMDIYNPVSHTIVQITGASVPTNIKGVDYIDGYLLAWQSNSNKFYFSEIDNAFSWSPVDYAESLSVADSINGLVVRDNRIYVFGEKSIEQWYNDGISPFRRLDGGLISTGCSAPYSILNNENGIFFLDTNRRVAMLQGGSISFLSQNVDKLIQTFNTVSDAYFHYVVSNGQDFLLCFFPSSGSRYNWDGGAGSGMCLVFNFQSKTWSDWTTWSDNGMFTFRDMFAIRHHCYAVAQKRNICGINNRFNLLAELLPGVYKERGLESNPWSPSNPQYNGIHSEIRTGYIDWGTANRKFCSKVRVRVNRPNTSSILKFSTIDDDGNSVSSRTEEISGSSGVMFYSFTQLGSYYVRQYRVEHNSDSDFTIGNITENVNGGTH